VCDYPYGWESSTAKLYTGGGSTDGGTLATAYADASSGGSDPNAVDMWYVISPQQWSCAATNTPWTGRPVPTPSPDFGYYPKPMSYAWDSPYTSSFTTYSFTQSVATKQVGYNWASTGYIGSSKRSFGAYASAKGKVAWRFEGTSFKWIFNKGTRGGICRVWVDGNAVTPDGYASKDVDQFNAGGSLFKQELTVSGLTNVWHNVEVTGTGSTSSTTVPKGYFIYHDAFVDPDGNLNGDAQYAENNYDGNTRYEWESTAWAGASGGAFVSCKDSSAPTAFTFQVPVTAAANRKVTWSYVTGPSGGIQRVFIDGQYVGNIDQRTDALAAGSATWLDGSTYGGQVLTMADSSWHTMFIMGTGTTNSTYNPKRYFLYSDAFTVGTGTTPIEAE